MTGSSAVDTLEALIRDYSQLVASSPPGTVFAYRALAEEWLARLGQGQEERVRLLESVVDTAQPDAPRMRRSPAQVEGGTDMVTGPYEETP